MADFRADYTENVRDFSRLVRAEESFDLIRRRLAPGVGELTLFYIDGFVKDDTLQRLMQYFLDRGSVTETAAEFTISPIRSIISVYTATASFLLKRTAACRR